MARLTVGTIAPEAYQAVNGMESYSRRHNDPVLYELIKLRASMINGCAFCVDMHSRDALTAGEDSRRLFGLAAWHDAPFYTERERAALAFTEAVTLVASTRVPAEEYDAVAAYWSPDEVGALLSLIVTINAWNALAVATRAWEPVLGG